MRTSIAATTAASHHALSLNRAPILGAIECTEDALNLIAHAEPDARLLDHFLDLLRALHTQLEATTSPHSQ
jgi:hypothetical protein